MKQNQPKDGGKIPVITVKNGTQAFFFFFMNGVVEHFGLLIHPSVMETFGKTQAAQVRWAECS